LRSAPALQKKEEQGKISSLSLKNEENLEKARKLQKNPSDIMLCVHQLVELTNLTMQ
jgi:hypothetical protein